MAAALHPLSNAQISDGDGEPFAGALLYSFAAGTDTPLPIYSDTDLTTPRSNPVEADADGRFPELFMLPTGYDLEAKDADDVLIYSEEHWSDPGTVFAGNFGTSMTDGAALNVTSGYVVTATNLLVTVASSGATTINLPAVSSRTQPVCIKNMLVGTVVVTPNGSDTIDGSLATYIMPSAISPLFPTVWLYPGVGTWWIFASHVSA